MSQALPRKPRILHSKAGKLAIVASKYNELYSDSLVENAIHELSELLPQSRVDLVRVPGAFEIPVTVKALMELEMPICVVALGVIIRGETSHADLVARNVTDSLQQLALEYRTPVIHEVLLVEDEAQAHLRCIGDKMNRGVEAARTAASMVDVLSELDRSGSLRNSTKNG